MHSSTIDPYYTSRYVWDKDRNIVWKEIVRFLAPYLCSIETVLDLGAGYCDFINNVTAQHRIAVDYSPEFEKFAAIGVDTFRSVATNLSDVSSHTVGLVFSSNLLEHLDDQDLEQVMSEIKRVLKPHGWFITMQPNYHLSYKTYFDDPTHKKIFSDTALQNYLISQGFSIVKMYSKFLSFSLKSRPNIIPLFSWMVRMYLHSPWKPFAGQMLCVSVVNSN